MARKATLWGDTRRQANRRGNVCSRCDKPRDRTNSRYCRACRAEYARLARKARTVEIAALRAAVAKS